jgi:hypothetical protein
VCEPNAGVASCAFDDGSAGVQETEALCIFDDEEGGAVFDGAAGVLEFGFAEDVAAGFLGEALEAYERSFADCWDEISIKKSLEDHRNPPSMKPRCPMPCALDMLMAVWCPASV